MSFQSFNDLSHTRSINRMPSDLPDNYRDSPYLPPSNNSDRLSRLGFRVATAFLLAFLSPFAEYLGTVGIQYLEHYRFHKFPLVMYQEEKKPESEPTEQTTELPVVELPLDPPKKKTRKKPANK